MFYGVFAFVLFPNRDVIHFPLAEGAAAAGGGALTAATNLMRYWSFSLFFIVSELWASAGVPLLFWQVSIMLWIAITMATTSFHSDLVSNNTVVIFITVCQRCYAHGTSKTLLSSLRCHR